MTKALSNLHMLLLATLTWITGKDYVARTLSRRFGPPETRREPATPENKHST